MTVIDWFAGIGGFHSGLEQAGMKVIGWCESDKYARKSYEAMYDTEGLWTAEDVRMVKGAEVPKADVWTLGFPCQDVSIAGKRKGMGMGTRSGLFFEIMRLIDEAGDNKPRWLIIENVKNLLSIERGHAFLRVLDEMAERGYSVEWKVYNSKDYGVPQNRERVYIVGYLGDTGGRKLLPTARKSGNSIKQLGNIAVADYFGGNPQNGRIYSFDGISPTLRTCTGGGHEPKILVTDEDGNKRIRKMTQKEFWRGQGFTDEQFEKAAEVNSKAQLYKQAGNAVTVPVVKEIGLAIMAFERDGD